MKKINNFEGFVYRHSHTLVLLIIKVSKIFDSNFSFERYSNTGISKSDVKMLTCLFDFLLFSIHT